MATTAIYNGITFHNIKTRDISYQTRFDKSGVDPIYTEVTVTFTSLIHTAKQNTIGYRGGKIHDEWEKIQRALNMPRREFRFLLANKQLFWVGPGAVRSGSPVAARQVGKRTSVYPDGTVDIAGDCNHGPIPSVRLNKFVNDYSVSVDFTVKLHLVLCDFEYQPNLSEGITNFRYWANETIDGDTWLTVRTYSGRIRVSHPGVNVHEKLRNANIIPPLQRGFKRDRIHIRQDPNGIEADFQIVDREIVAAPPWPASKWSGYHLITTPYGGAPTAEGDIHVSLEGPRNVAKSELMKLAANIIDSRVHFSEMAAGDYNSVLLGLNMRSSFDRNQVEMSAKISYIGDKDGGDVPYLYNLFTNDINSWYTQAGYDRELAYPFEPTAGLAGLLATALQDPCHSARMPQGSGAQSSTLTYKKDDDADNAPTVSVDTGPLDQSQNNYSDEHKRKAFTRYHIDSDVEIDSGKVSVPLGQAVGGGGATNSVVTLHSGDARRIVEIRGERIGEWAPLIQNVDFVDTDSNGNNGIAHTVIRWDLLGKNSQLSADGRKTLYKNSQRVVYSLGSVPQDNVHEFPMGKTPYRSDRTNVVVAAMTSAAFVPPTDII